MKIVRFITLSLTVFLAISPVARSEPVLILAGLIFAYEVSENNDKNKADNVPMDWRATLTEEENRNIEQIGKDPVIQACLEQANNHNNPVAQYHLRKIAGLSSKIKSEISKTGDIGNLDKYSYKRPVQGFIWCKRNAGIIVENNIAPYMHQEYVIQIAQLGQISTQNIHVVMAEDKEAPMGIE
ncbi:MAG TPA: hypothetical protein ENI65_05795 [Gammaproteobacteria bacterium]|nr:hypothetical protein [Gammaproteobacteria bacterium]